MLQRTFLPKLYVDLDDVVAQTLREFIRVLERRFGRSVDFENVHSFHLGRSFDLSDSELKAFLSAAHEPAVLSAVQPLPGSAETLGRLMNHAYIIIVTGRPTFTYDTTVEWLGRHAIPYHAVRFLKKYVENETNDASLREPLSLRSLRKGEFTFAVEDSPKMAKYFASKLKVPIALLDKPWNRVLTIPPRHRALCTRVQRWQDVEDWFHRTMAMASDDRESQQEWPVG